MTASQYIAILQERRRANLQRLAEQAGSQAKAAEQMGMDRGQLSNLLGGKLTVSEYRARKAEQFLGLAYGVLDLPLP